MRIDWWTLALQAINVVVLIWLLSRFLYRPVLGAIAARQGAAEKLLSEARAAKDRAQAEEAELRKKAKALAEDEGRLRAQAQAEAAADRAALLDQATAEAAKARQEGSAALARERQSVRKALETEAVALAITIAERLLRRLPPEAATEPMFQALLDHIRALSEADQNRLVEPGAPIEICTAESLEEAEEARYRSALAGILPHLTAVRFRRDPALIAGFELHGPGLAVSNSWRADLDRISRELAEVRDAPSGLSVAAHHDA